MSEPKTTIKACADYTAMVPKTGIDVQSREAYNYEALERKKDCNDPPAPNPEEAKKALQALLQEKGVTNATQPYLEYTYCGVLTYQIEDIVTDKGLKLKAYRSAGSDEIKCGEGDSKEAAEKTWLASAVRYVKSNPWQKYTDPQFQKIAVEEQERRNKRSERTWGALDKAQP